MGLLLSTRQVRQSCVFTELKFQLVEKFLYISIQLQ